jgi:ATP diphosphatase
MDEAVIGGEEAQAGAAKALQRSAAIMARLRRVPDGCPWDLEQTFDSIKKHTLEETYEVFDAIERRAWPELKDELGDLLLQVLFYAQMAKDAGYFDIADVAETLNAKLVRRHPHIFPAKDGGTVVAEDAGTVVKNWEAIKVEEKRARGEVGGMSLLDEVARTMPAMMEAMKISSKAAKVGFDWQNAGEILAKVEEEVGEFGEELAAGDRKAAEGEFGDMLFSMLNLARFLKIDPESALRRTNAKFRRRFAAVEGMVEDVSALQACSVQELDALWVRAKAAEGRGEK